MPLTLSADTRMVLARMSFLHERAGGGRVRLSRDQDVVLLLNEALAGNDPALQREAQNLLAGLAAAERNALIAAGARLPVTAAPPTQSPEHPFSDLYVLQLIGLLRARGFTGTVDLTTAAGQACLGFAGDGTLSALETDAEPAVLLWQASGTLRLNAGGGVPALDAHDPLLDAAIGNGRPDLPDSCPLLAAWHLTRTPRPPVGQSPYHDDGFAVLVNLRQGTRPMQVRGNLSDGRFWPALFHLFSRGQVVGSYAPTVGAALRRLQERLVAVLEQYLGGEAHGYADEVRHALRARWTPADDPFDPVYGSMPYRHWAAAQETALEGFGEAARQAYRDLRAALDTPETVLLDYLARTPA